MSEKKKNLPVRQQFRQFMAAARANQPPVTRVSIPAFSFEIDYREAEDWFDKIEDMLYDLIGWEMPVTIADKALIVAFSGDERLPPSMVMEQFGTPIVVNGVEHDQWLVFSKEPAQIYEVSMVLENPDDPDCFLTIPAIDPELIEAMKEKWRTGQSEAKGQGVDLYIAPAFRAGRKLRRTTLVQDEELYWNTADRQFRKAFGRKAEDFGPVKAFAIKVPQFQCRERARRGKAAQAKPVLRKIRRYGRIQPEKVLVEQPIASTLKHKVMKKEWAMAARKYGFMAQMDGQTLLAPKEDFYGHEDQGLLFEEPLSLRPWYERNRSEDPMVRAPYTDLRLLIKAQRMAKAGLKPAYECLELLPRYPVGQEPPIWMLGHRTGNLYRVIFIKYVGHLKEKVKPRSWLWNRLSDRAVCVEVLDGQDSEGRTVLPWREEGLEMPEGMTYFNPLNGKRVLSFEDELFTMNDNRMVPVDLYRFIERQR